MWKWGVVLLALAGASFALWLSFKGVTPPPVPPPHREPARNPYTKGLAGAGVVEPASENVVIGVSEQGRISKVFVEEGQRVKRGDPLFQIDPRALEAELGVARAVVRSAEAELRRVEGYRRKEEEPQLRAQVAQATALVEAARGEIEQAAAQVKASEWAKKDLEAQRTRLEGLVGKGGVPEQDLERVVFGLRIEESRVRAFEEAVKTARYRSMAAESLLRQHQATLDLFLAGPWPPDLNRAKALLEEAGARATRLEQEIERRMIRAPMDATVLRRKMREGEYAKADQALAENAGIVLGNLDQLHVRVDIDEFDAQRYRPGLPAVAKLKGEAGEGILLDFVRIEPFVIPKRALTNSQRELVDTRVLQAIYRIRQAGLPIYVGQQLDVFINLDPARTAVPGPGPAAPQ